MRLGLLGGTFNPPHLGHVICAQEARLQLDLDEVDLMPVSSPPHRDMEEEPGAGVRVRMCRAAVEGQDGLRVLTVEIDRGGSSYTVDTLESLSDQKPTDELTLVIGADQALTFGNWREPERIASLARIAVAARADADRQAALDEVRRASGAEPVLVNMPRIDISSSLVRERAAAGIEFSHLLPAEVSRIVHDEGLYR
jgi:nicotinate-nucleotide adenylyltransferase